MSSRQFFILQPSSFILHHRSGVSLVELLVALVLLELTGVAALMAILTSERVSRRTTAGSLDDPQRWRQFRELEVAASCADTNSFRPIALMLPATTVRPPFSGVLSCGR